MSVSEGCANTFSTTAHGGILCLNYLTKSIQYLINVLSSCKVHRSLKVSNEFCTVLIKVFELWLLTHKGM